MNTQILKRSRAMLLVLVVLSIFVYSCDDKMMDEHSMNVNFSYLPNPVVLNSPCTFTFETMEESVYKDVTDFNCMFMPDETTTIPLTKATDGKYTGTYTFTTAGTYTLMFEYMHDSEMGEKEFTITVN